MNNNRSAKLIIVDDETAKNDLQINLYVCYSSGYRLGNYRQNSAL